MGSLDLSNNQIKDIAPARRTEEDARALSGRAIRSKTSSRWPALKNLERLDLRGTGISDLSPLAEHTEWRFLFLNDNKITDLSRPGRRGQEGFRGAKAVRPVLEALYRRQSAERRRQIRAARRVEEVRHSRPPDLSLIAKAASYPTAARIFGGLWRGDLSETRNFPSFQRTREVGCAAAGTRGKVVRAATPINRRAVVLSLPHPLARPARQGCMVPRHFCPFPRPRKARHACPSLRRSRFVLSPAGGSFIQTRQAPNPIGAFWQPEPAVRVAGRPRSARDRFGHDHGHRLSWRGRSRSDD